MGIYSKFHKRVGLNKGNSRKAVPNKRVGWKICLLSRVEKGEQGGKNTKNANRVDSFIWHLRVSKKLHYHLEE